VRHALGELHECPDNFLGRLETSHNSFEVASRIDCAKIYNPQQPIESVSIGCMRIEE
jgi:hypothetical protein